MIKKYKAMVLSCIDPRFQSVVYSYLKNKKLNGKYSSFTIAGSAIGVTAPKFRKWHKTFWDNLETSIQLHKIKKLIVINHRDCGAAKIINGKKTFDNFHETKIHKSSFNKIKKRFKNKYPNLNIETILISLNKTVEKF
jgi:carbonic anhydrase